MLGDLCTLPHCCGYDIRVSWFKDTTRIAPSSCLRSLWTSTGPEASPVCRTGWLFLYNGVAIVSGRTGDHEIELNETDIDRIILLFDQGRFLTLQGKLFGSAWQCRFNPIHHKLPEQNGKRRGHSDPCFNPAGY